MTELRIRNITLRGITQTETRYFSASLRTFQFLVHRPSDKEVAIAIIEVLKKKGWKRLIIDRYAPSPIDPHPLIPTPEETLAHLRQIRWRDFMPLVNEHPRSRITFKDIDRWSLPRRRLTEEGWAKLDALDLSSLGLTPRRQEIARTIIKHRSVRRACEELHLSSFWVGTIWSSLRVRGLEWPEEEPYDPAPPSKRGTPLQLRIKQERDVFALGYGRYFKVVVVEGGQIAVLEADAGGHFLVVGPYTPPPLRPVPPGTPNYPYGGGRPSTAEEAELREIEAAASRWWRFREWVNTHPARRANI